MATVATYVGSPVGRKEDAKLLTGQGRYVDDLTLPGMVHAMLVRSPYAHAQSGGTLQTPAPSAEGRQNAEAVAETGLGA